MTGCLTPNSETSLVPANPFLSATETPVRSRVAYAPASIQSAARVDTLGRKIVAANKLGVKPLFRTIGSPQPELFHVGTAEIIITEGMVNQCQTEAELAAVLCRELGNMISEREVLAGPQIRCPEREPPMDVRVGNDNAGAFGPADQTHLAELGKFEKEQRRSSSVPPPPDPQVLARTYLKQAGFAEKDLDAVASILQAAAANSNFEKQFNSTTPSRPWVR
jgi:hypothetical protein